MADWRDDPRWCLVRWYRDYWTSEPRRPTAQAERSSDGLWCDHYVENRPVATWFLDVTLQVEQTESAVSVERAGEPDSAATRERAANEASTGPKERSRGTRAAPPTLRRASRTGRERR